MMCTRVHVACPVYDANNQVLYNVSRVSGYEKVDFGRPKCENVPKLVAYDMLFQYMYIQMVATKEQHERRLCVIGISVIVPGRFRGPGLTFKYPCLPLRGLSHSVIFPGFNL